MDFLSGPEVTAQGLMVLNGKRVDLEWKYGRIFFAVGLVRHWHGWPSESGCVNVVAQRIVDYGFF